LLVCIPFVSALFGQGGNINVTLMTDTEMNVTNISQDGYVFNSSGYAYPTGKYITGDIVLILGSLESGLNDFFDPQYENISISPRLGYTNQEVSVDVDAYDNIGIIDQWVNITFPDSSSIFNATPYPFNFTATQTGTYSIKFFAIDTSSNWGVSPFYLVTIENPVTFTSNITTHATSNTSVEFYYDSTFSATNESRNNISLVLPETTYQTMFSAFSNTLTLYYDSLDTTVVDSINLSIDKFTNYLGYDNIYHIGTDYDAPVKINMTYSGIANENYLFVYVCSAWDYTNMNCSINWTSISATQDMTLDRINISPASMNMTTAYAIQQAPYCGDSTCGMGETCSNCASDCGACASEDSGETETIVDTDTPPTQTVEPDVKEYYYSFISKETGINLELRNTNIPLENIRATLSNDIRNVRFEIKSLIESELISYSVPKLQDQVPDAIVYDYVIISHENINQSEVIESEFTFKVSQSWYNSNDVEDEDTRIYKYIDGTWTAMNITDIIEDSSEKKVTIKTQGFSLFSVAALKEDTTTPLEQETRFIEAVQKEISRSDIIERKEAGLQWWVYFAIIIGGFSMLGVYYGVSLAKDALQAQQYLTSLNQEVQHYFDQGWRDVSVLENKLNDKYPEKVVAKVLKKYEPKNIAVIMKSYGLMKPFDNNEKLHDIFEKIKSKENINMEQLFSGMEQQGWSSEMLQGMKQMHGEISERYASEEKYIKEYISKVKQYGFSPAVVKDNLLSKGMDPQLVEKIMREYETQE
jgi:PGF-pre-PGF domain-containing protein